MKTANLDSVLPDYKKVTEAPTYSAICKICGDDAEKIRQYMRAEWRKLYKATKKREGEAVGVFLVQNPALLIHQSKLSADYLRRKPPVFIGTLEEIAKKEKRGDAGFEKFLI